MTEKQICCLLCKSSTDDEADFGNLITIQHITVHYFCLLLSPALYQRGITDSDGIHGFVTEDIIKESNRLSRLKCRYCHSKNANLGCSVQNCRLAFHISCGRANGALYEFCDRYQTFCKKHLKIKRPKPKTSESSCGICLDQMSTDIILIPCCKRNFHRKCLQKFAQTSGICFKCPLCNNKDICIKLLPMMGIFLQDKEADWELDEDGFEEILQSVHITCEAENCICNNDDPFEQSPWFWKVCQTCAAAGVYKTCFSGDEYTCKDCSRVLNSMQSMETNMLSQLQLESNSETTLSVTSNERSATSSSFRSWFSDDEQYDEAENLERDQKRRKIA